MRLAPYPLPSTPLPVTPLTSRCDRVERMGMPPSTYSFGQKTLLYLLNAWSNSIRLNSYFHYRNSTKPFSLWDSKECCLCFFYYGYDQTQYCYPGILLCGNEENQFHFPKEGLKCLKSGCCSFIRGVLSGFKREGQEIE